MDGEKSVLHKGRESANEMAHSPPSNSTLSRLLVGGDYRRLVPVSALMGGVVLVLSDIAARMINAPFDTPVGALVSILGVPVFFALTFRKEGMVL